MQSFFYSKTWSRIINVWGPKNERNKKIKTDELSACNDGTVDLKVTEKQSYS